ncbi:ABC transporter substrate-binding protein [Natronosporangium hydrolyticum]|uniref:ABC transporter substrate-binding protein n=1 Tax=Natronosporangium hydrolyticum TaxID=2811111 RepID=A0A895YGP7_9ACTN|nr:ABC transporter substrate-binding protein [Natronosporangium hydrolyticum]QSB13706.1 ABC transporter substrate-binding protein [Natronosporangium hydrolyticum]
MRRLIIAGAAGMALVVALGACRGDAGGEQEEIDGLSFDVGVTTDPCPNAVDEENGCIYLGTLSDLSVGPFAPLAVPLTAAQEAFWQRVNEEGGITADGVDQAFEVDVTSYQRDTQYNPTEHSRHYEEIKPNILALAQTLGSATTNAIISDMDASDIIAAPAAWSSLYAFEELILESGANYCVESMNAVDYAVEAHGVDHVMAVHYEDDYGEDAAAGAMIAAEANGLEFTSVATPTGSDNQEEAIGRILAGEPDLVIVTTGPSELAAIVGGAAAQGFLTARYIGTSPTWNPALLETAAGEALAGLYEQTGPWVDGWDGDTPGHQAMREALGDVTDINDGYTSGWIWSYPIKAALEAAMAEGDLTRAGVRAAATSLTSVDYEGMLPAEAGNYAAGPEGQLRANTINQVDPESSTGVSVGVEMTTGPTAESFELTQPCYELLD